MARTIKIDVGTMSPEMAITVVQKVKTFIGSLDGTVEVKI